MRIGIFIKNTTLHKNFGGLEVQNRTLAEGLAKLGYELFVFSPKNDLAISSITENSVNYVFIDAPYKNNSLIDSILNFNIKNQWYKKSYELFLTYHAKSKFDLVISQSSAGLGIIKNKNFLNIPIVSICHGSILSEFKTLLTRKKTFSTYFKILKDFEYVIRTYFTTQKEFILKSDFVIAVSNVVKQSVIEETGLSSNKIDVIHNGVMIESLAYNKPTDTIDILFVGRVEEDKGVQELLEIFYKLHNKVPHSIRLVIVGAGSYIEKLQSQAVSMGLDDCVLFKGYLSGCNLFSVYNSSHIFVLPTKRVEGFPVTIPEAMSYYLPIVATNMGGIKEGVFDNDTGFLIAPYDFSAFEEKLKILITNSAKREFFAKQARLKAETLFSEDIMIKKYETIINNLLKCKICA